MRSPVIFLKMSEIEFFVLRNDRLYGKIATLALAENARVGNKSLSNSAAN
jgi:hypothetical protein